MAPPERPLIVLSWLRWRPEAPLVWPENSKMTRNIAAVRGLSEARFLPTFHEPTVREITHPPAVALALSEPRTVFWQPLADTTDRYVRDGELWPTGARRPSGPMS